MRIADGRALPAKWLAFETCWLRPTSSVKALNICDAQASNPTDAACSLSMAETVADTVLGVSQGVTMATRALLFALIATVAGFVAQDHAHGQDQPRATVPLDRPHDTSPLTCIDPTQLAPAIRDGLEAGAAARQARWVPEAREALVAVAVDHLRRQAQCPTEADIPRAQAQAALLANRIVDLAAQDARFLFSRQIDEAAASRRHAYCPGFWPFC